jgi:hypothetical protein
MVLLSMLGAPAAIRRSKCRKGTTNTSVSDRPGDSQEAKMGELLDW